MVRRRRSVLAALAASVAAAVVVSFIASPSAAARSGGAGTCWRPPVAGVVVDPFREPPCTWCAGNRGLEYVVDRPGAVRAAATGRIEFAGSVAGVSYVVVRLPNGWRHTYGRLAATSVSAGAAVLAGTVVGTTYRELFFGLRIGDRYVDPAPRIGDLVVRPRLVPADGSPGRPASPAVLRCAPTTAASGPTGSR